MTIAASVDVVAVESVATEPRSPSCVDDVVELAVELDVSGTDELVVELAVELDVSGTDDVVVELSVELDVSGTDDVVVVLDVLVDVEVDSLVEVDVLALVVVVGCWSPTQNETWLIAGA